MPNLPGSPRPSASSQESTPSACINAARHYIFTAKGRQPGLHRQLRSLPWKDVLAGQSQTGRGHGRIEKRTVRAVTVTAGLAFPHARCPQREMGAPSSPNGSAGTGNRENQLHWVRSPGVLSLFT
jgi:hypothetical protein